MTPKAPAMLVVLVETERLRWFVAAVDLDGPATPLLRSEESDLEKVRTVDFDEQVAFLRHRFCGILQRGCDRLWGRQRKACQFAVIFERPLPAPTGALSQAVAEHFVLWMLNPPVVVLVSGNGFDQAEGPRLERIAGELEPARERLLSAHLGELLAARGNLDAWEQVRKNGAWCG